MCTTTRYTYTRPAEQWDSRTSGREQTSRTPDPQDTRPDRQDDRAADQQDSRPAGRQSNRPAEHQTRRTPDQQDTRQDTRPAGLQTGTGRTTEQQDMIRPAGQQTSGKAGQANQWEIQVRMLCHCMHDVFSTCLIWWLF